jgi:tryptophanyl-tRNA synthetase
MRERRSRYESRPGYVDEIIIDGTERTRAEVKSVVAEAKKAMGLTGTYNQLRRKAEQARKRRGQ